MTSSQKGPARGVGCISDTDKVCTQSGFAVCGHEDFRGWRRRRAADAIFAALGADCTVFDYSDQQLALEREVAEREGYTIRIVKGDMTKPLPFADDEFDVILHPVSNCYVEDVYHVWNECYRILKPGGVLLAGMDNGLNFLVNDDGKLPLTITNKLPYNPPT